MRSGDQGCNGHWILRRVPGDGRHPRSSRAVAFHRAAVTAASAALSSIRSVRKLPRETARTRARAKAREHGRQEGEATGMSEARSESAPWEDNAHARDRLRQRGTREAKRRDRVRRSEPGDVKHSVPRSSRAEPRLREASALRKQRQDPGTREVRVHAVRMGGRSRSDASCVSPAAGSQGTVVNGRTLSPKEARSSV